MEVSSEGVDSDVYLPVSGTGWGIAPPRGCLVLAHGMTDLGRRDPRLASFARSLARLGFLVTVPDLPGMKRFRPARGDLARISSAFRQIEGRFISRERKCVLFAFSFAAGPALMAGAAVPLRGRLAGFVGVGAYFDLKNVLRYMTTSGREDFPAFPGGPPVRAGKWLFLRYNPDLLGLAKYKKEIGEIVRRKLARKDADIKAYVQKLPPSGRRLLALMQNRDPKRFDALYASQPQALRARLEEWSLKKAVASIGAPLFLLHGRGDPFVPPDESARLAARARGGGNRRVRLLVLSGFGHVDPAASPSWLAAAMEAARLAGFVSEVLSMAEGG